MVNIVNLTRHRLPNIKWQKIASKILSDKFDLSVVLIGEKRMGDIKKKYPPIGKKRSQNNKPTDVLSFLISKNVGEIFLCPKYIKHDAKNFSRSYKEHIIKVYIHGLLHLKGYDHLTRQNAIIMERKEDAVFRRLRKDGV